MIVIGADTHKQSHTCAAAKAGTGELAGERTAAARKPGFRELLDWGRSLDEQRIWALEDCRHVSGSFERFLVAEGERVVRVAPKLMGQSRKGERARGKSDPIDALAVARAALKEGPQTLPAAHLDERALELKLLLDHREDLVRSRAEDQQRLRWHLHDLWPELRAAGRLPGSHRLARPARPQALASRADGPRSHRPRAGARDPRPHPPRLRARARDHARSSAPRRRSCLSCPAAARSPPRSSSPRPPASSALHPTRSSPGSPASPRSRPPRATATATASTAAATASSTAPCTGSRSPRDACIRPRASSSPASRPRANREWRRFAASSATSPEPSGTLFAPPATESRSTPSPLLMKFPNCGQLRRLALT